MSQPTVSDTDSVLLNRTGTDGKHSKTNECINKCQLFFQIDLLRHIYVQIPYCVFLIRAITGIIFGDSEFYFHSMDFIFLKKNTKF